MVNPPILHAVSSSARQLLILLRCLPSASKAHVRLSPEGLRISTDDGSAMESFIFVEKALFTSYAYQPRSIGDGMEQEHLVFQINLNALIETLNIFTLSDVPVQKQSATTEAYAAHRLNRHAGINAFSNNALGMTGICSLMFEDEGSPLSIHMSDAGVTTTCELTTYSAAVLEEIPFARDSIALKTIMRATYILDAILELSSLSPKFVTITATAATNSNASLSLSTAGTLGSATVDFAAKTAGDEATLETFYCPVKTSASFRFAHIKTAQRAMGTASKVSLRLDEQGVLSMQFLVELEAHGAGSGVAFVDFKIVPLVDGEAEDDLDGDVDDQ